ncbi:MAG: ATP-binding protein [Ruegeria sp.]|uniref:ATP-binding protein n=1 Tax=Ruegeria sp. TaxID=1879320 RepID=UPI00349EF9C4
MTDWQEATQNPDRVRNLISDAIESLSEGFALYDENRKLVICNQRYREMNAAVAEMLEPGLDWEILMRETARRGIYADAVGREEEWVRNRLETTHDHVTDFELKQTDGRCYLVSTHPTSLGGFVVTRTDITDRKRAEEAQRDGDTLVRTVLDASSAVVIMTRVGSGEIIYRSPAAKVLFGKTKSASEHYVNPEDRADFVTELLAAGQINNYRLRVRAQGREFPALLSARIVEYHGEDVIVTSVIDLTKEVEAQALIRRVLEACPVPVQMTNAETGKVLFSSPETTALFGRVDSARSYYADADERAAYLEELKASGFVKNRRARFINKAGEEFWGSVSSRLIEFHGEPVIVSNTRDMTDELAMQEELDLQREMVFQNEKMSALGELLAGVAHELNNPLSVVVGHALMMQEDTLDPDVQRRVEKIASAAERCAKIVKTFLAMARQSPSQMEPVDIGSVVATAVDVAGYGHTQDGLMVRYQPPGALPDILADADQITQVIINLIINAVQAITKSGTGDRVDIVARASGEMVEVAVEDNGPGIPDAHRARIFEPFFTTKEVGDGTGIGLTICHRIIHSHGGRIRLDAEYEGGTRIVIQLPVAPAEHVEDEETDAANGVPRPCRVLIVDDEQEVAALMAEALRRDGFLVEVAGSGDEALTKLETAGFDVLLSDLNMPGVDGRALFEALQARFPDMVGRTAFITGDTMGASSQAMLREAGRPYLEKPVAPRELRQLVQDILKDAKDR